MSQYPYSLRTLRACLSHDYVIKYAYYVKWYLERFASVSDPKKWTTYAAERKKHVKHDFK